MKYDKSFVVDEPVDGFGIGDLFMSRTDERGVIQTGNEVFRRLSGYDWDALIGAPHRIIRHPDMPKAAFWLLWEMIQQGKSFGGFVKNRAASGRYYWVFAIVAPVEGGYLSVRLRPSSPLQAAVEALYRETLQRETDGASPEEAAAGLLASVQALGYKDYTAFMAHALCTECRARAEALGAPADPRIATFRKVSEALDQMSANVARVVTLFEKIGNSPVNLNILGSRLPVGREQMQEVARNYSILSGELHRSIDALSAALEILTSTAQTARFDMCASAIYAEAIPVFEAETDHPDPETMAREIAKIKTAFSEFRERASAECDRILSEAQRFSEHTVRLRKMLSGLSVTRVICRISAASIDADTTSIDEIANTLIKFQEEVGLALDEIAQSCNTIVQLQSRPS